METKTTDGDLRRDLQPDTNLETDAELMAINVGKAVTRFPLG